MSITPASSSGLSLGIAAAAGGIGLTAGLGLGYLTTVDDGSYHHGTRNGFSHKTEAPSREVAEDRIDSHRQLGTFAAIAGGVLTGVGMLTSGYTRGTLLLAGGSFLGYGLGAHLQLRDSDEKIRHLPSEADLPPKQVGPWRPKVELPSLFPTLAERLADMPPPVSVP